MRNALDGSGEAPLNSVRTISVLVAAAAAAIAAAIAAVRLSVGFAVPACIG